MEPNATQRDQDIIVNRENRIYLAVVLSHLGAEDLAGVASQGFMRCRNWPSFQRKSPPQSASIVLGFPRLSDADRVNQNVFDRTRVLSIRQSPTAWASDPAYRPLFVYGSLTLPHVGATILRRAVRDSSPNPPGEPDTTSQTVTAMMCAAEVRGLRPAELHENGDAVVEGAPMESTPAITAAERAARGQQARKRATVESMRVCDGALIFVRNDWDHRALAAFEASGTHALVKAAILVDDTSLAGPPGTKRIREEMVEADMYVSPLPSNWNAAHRMYWSDKTWMVSSMAPRLCCEREIAAVEGISA